MVGALLHTEHFQPWRCLGNERRSGDHTRTLPRYITPGELRRQCEKELVYRATRHKHSEKSRTSFVEQELHREFIPKEFQNRGGCNSAFMGFHSPHFSRREGRHSVFT